MVEEYYDMEKVIIKEIDIVFGIGAVEFHDQAHVFCLAY
jgi:hypothetical protein